MPLKCDNANIGHASLYRQFKYEISWISERNYGPGALVELRVQGIGVLVGWVFKKWAFDKGDILFSFPAVPVLAFNEMFTDMNHTVFRVRLNNGLRRGETATITLFAVPDICADVNVCITIWVNDPSNDDGYLQEDGFLTLVSNPGPVERLHVYSRPAARNGKVRITIVPEDKYSNPTKFNSKIKAKLYWNDTEQEIEIQETYLVYLPAPKLTSHAKLVVPISELTTGEDICNANIADGLFTVYGNPVIVPDKYKPTFGEFHWHSEISMDGERSLCKGFDYAYNFMNLDCACSADHNTQGEDWEHTVAVSDEYNSDEFTTIYGWENSSNRGHDNYYFKYPDHPLICGGSAGFYGGKPEKVDTILQEYNNFIAAPHHTNITAETKTEEGIPYWFQYSIHRPLDCYRLIEVFQCRGNSEADDQPDMFYAWHQQNNASVRDFLNAGYKMGFTGGTDNHNCYPGRASCEGDLLARADLPAGSKSLTGIWVDDFTRESLFDALYTRRTWAVWDTRAIAKLTINGVMQGGDLSVNKNDPLIASIEIQAEKPFRLVEIIGRYGVILSENCDSCLYKKDVKLETGQSDYYYVRAVLLSGGIIYISPVFINFT